MTRLKKILLTGTMVPTLALLPIAGAFAQIPATVQRQIQERQEQQQRGAPQQGAGAPRAQGGEMHQPMQQRPQMQQRGEQAPARQASPAGQRPVERAAPNRMEAPTRAERPAERPTPAARSAPVERPAPAERPTPAARPAPVERPSPPAVRAERPGPPASREAHPDEQARPNETGVTQNRAQQNRPDQPRPTGNPGADQTPGAAANRPIRNGDQAGRPGHPGAPGQPNQPGNRNDQRQFDRGDNDRRGGIGPGGAAAIGAAAGFAGGFLAATGAHNLSGIRNDRRESVEDGRTYIREPGRTIVEDGDRSYIVHDENDRFRELGYDVRRERRGDDFVDVVNRPDGTQILTYTTPDGRMLRRVRRYRDGREYVLIDNGFNGRVRPIQDNIVDLPPPPIDIPRDRYDVDYADVDEGVIYDTFAAPPLRAPPRRYTLDQIRYSPDIRRYVRSVDINTINFDSGSWIVPGAATGKLQALAAAIKRTLSKDPNSVFLVEGYTDATGNPTDNLSLSDRRAQSVAAILTKDFAVPPENLTTQGYGQQNLKVNTRGPSVENRRVVVQNITPLLAAGGNPPPR